MHTISFQDLLTFKPDGNIVFDTDEVSAKTLNVQGLSIGGVPQ